MILAARALVILSAAAIAATASTTRGRPAASRFTPPAIAREFRAAWVATVDNIDWPSKRGLPVDQQKREIIAILDAASRLRLNAIVLQVRPACDALYDSKLEPWSDYLTGEMGRAPSPYYDPLKMWVAEAHKRGIELHAWFNPYRAHHPSSRSAISSGHISRTHPELVRTYGRHLWMDPGEKGVQNHSLAVILDVVRRYDIDGVHMDDYFYPYKEKDSSGSVIPFPDDPSWERYRERGGALARDDWRRENVNQFVKRLYREVKAAKPWVKVGISPFGIWRPGNPAQIKGFDQYAELYADARKWLQNGWVDYFAPQLYWKIDPPAQSYPVLLKWWTQQNPLGRHIWPGNYTSRVGIEGSWAASEIVKQIACTRSQAGAGGNIHFSMKALMRNAGGLADALAKGPYAEPALVPACPWLGKPSRARPALSGAPSPDRAGFGVKLRPARGSQARLWVVQVQRGDTWSTTVLPGANRSFVAKPAPNADSPLTVVVSAVDRFGNQSDPAIWRAPEQTSR